MESKWKVLYTVVRCTCNSPYKKVIIGVKHRIWTRGGVASVQQHVEPSRTDRGMLSVFLTDVIYS